MEMNLLNYPLGVQNFPSIREEGALYVDKTSYIHELLSNLSPFIFLSRPRRFGKSLLLSTLESYFKGKRDLFKGLAIDALEPDKWEEHAVIHLDFNGQSYEGSDSLKDFISRELDKLERIYGTNPFDTNIVTRFQTVIEHAYQKTGRGVVVLVDEYDKPLLDVSENKALEDANRETLRSFYSVMKTVQKHLRFVMLTGVGKIAQLNVFNA